MIITLFAIIVLGGYTGKKFNEIFVKKRDKDFDKYIGNDSGNTTSESNSHHILVEGTLYKTDDIKNINSTSMWIAVIFGSLMLIIALVACLINA